MWASQYNQSPVNRQPPVDIFDLDDRICKGHTVQCKKLEKNLCEFFSHQKIERKDEKKYGIRCYIYSLFPVLFILEAANDGLFKMVNKYTMLWKAATTILLNTNIYNISRYSSTYRAMMLDSLKIIQKYQLHTYYLPT